MTVTMKLMSDTRLTRAATPHKRIQKTAPEQSS